MGCTSSTDARDHTGTTYTATDTGVRIHWLGGAKVADDYEDFYDGGWDSTAPRNQAGGSITTNTGLNAVLSGCNDDGTAHSTSELGNSSVAFANPSGNSGLFHGITSPANSRKVFGLSPVFEVAAPISTTAVPTDWSLKPAGLSTGDQFRLLFLSSTKRDGSATAIATYNTFVQTRAAAGHTDIQAYSAGFNAVGCTADTDATANTGTIGTGVPVYWLNGNKVADDYADFYDGDWDEEANDKNELGANGPNTNQSANYPFTGCDHDGTEGFLLSDSVALGTSDVIVGRPNSSGTGHGPLSGGGFKVDTITRPMYGLSAVFEVAAVGTNFDATGKPAITGTAEVGQTLTASKGMIVDTNGTTKADNGDSGYAYTYQWVRVSGGTETTISSATGTTYTPVADDIGKTIKVQASFTDDADNAEGPLTSDATAAVVEACALWCATMTVGVSSGLSGYSVDVPTIGTLTPRRFIYNGATVRVDRIYFEVAYDELTIDFNGDLEGSDYTLELGNLSFPLSDPGTGSSWGVSTSDIDWTDGETVTVKLFEGSGGVTLSDDATLTSLDFYATVSQDAELVTLTPAFDAGTTAYTAVVDYRFITAAIENIVRGDSGASVVVTDEFASQDLGTDEDSVEDLQLAIGENTITVEVTAADGNATVTYTLVVTRTAPPPLPAHCETGDIWCATLTVAALSGSRVGYSGAQGALSHVAFEYGPFYLVESLFITTVSGVGTPLRIEFHPSGETVFNTDAYSLFIDGTEFAFSDATFTSGYFEWADSGLLWAPADTVELRLFERTAPAVRVPTDWSLIPAGLSTGDQFRLIFLSSTKRDGSATDIATYNSFVQTRAAAGHTDIQAYSAWFSVVGCTADTDAIVNTGTTGGGGVPIYWLNGDKVADDYADFYDGDWDEEAVNKNELGANGPDTAQSGNYPLTGCDADGTESLGSNRSWGLGTSDGLLTVGRPNSSGTGHGPLFSDSTALDTDQRPMYGLSAVFGVGVEGANSAPAFGTSTAARSVAENTAAGQDVGAVLTATDFDMDTLTYTLEGTNLLSFDLVTTSGSAQIRTKTGVTYDHEVKSSYTVVVKADDSNGGTAATVTVTIEITDVDEPPEQPLAPTVTATAGSTTSLDVSWTAPANTGPDIDNYDLQYREGTSGGFTNGPQDVTGTSAAIPSLDAGTAYQVQVRATNAEGDSDWSPSGTAAPCDGIWCATLTAQAIPGSGGGLGCANSSAGDSCTNTAHLTEDEFRHDMTDYQVTAVQVRNNNAQLQIWVSPDLTTATQSLVLHVDSESFAFEDADTKQASNRRWDSSGLSWSAGATIELKLTEAPAPPTAVPADWSLIPGGLTTGDKFRLIFLSSTKRDGSATAIATYNTFVQTRAAAGHTDIQAYSAGFSVVGCTEDVDATANTGTTGTGVPIYWLNGAKVADDYADFYDEDWDEEANDKNELGANGPNTNNSGNYPITGCDHDGTESFAGSNSVALGTSNWRTGRPNSATTGHGPLSGGATASGNRPMYGLSAVFEVAAAVVTNSDPTFTSSTAARSVAENTAAGQNVGAVLTATDSDGDTLTYTLEGTDAASFDIVTTADPAAQIRTKTGVTYNHEAQSTYTVVVKADDGNGGTDTVTVTITVTDVTEAPGRPAAPSVSATSGSTTSLDVSWTAPTNTGPDIDNYDLRYREGTSGSWTNGPQDQTGTSAAIGSLDAGTAYQVQVRATNAEGNSNWSQSGSGTTSTPINNDPTFPSSTAARSVAENTAAGQNVGAVLTATDSDGDTLTYTLEGTDAASFDIVTTADPAAQIRTKTGVTYNHEVKSTYTVVVKADDGNSGTDTVTVTITVTDVTEAPGRPAAPSVSATSGSTTSLDVSWTEPTNTGPDIDNYDLRYREGTSGGWTNGPQNVTGTSAAIGSLDAGTAYQVQVRATNAEGNSDWSQSGSGTTGTPSNNPPTFPSSTAARSVAENTAAGQNVGAVLTATDSDGDTLTYTLEGTDAASFALDTTTTAGSARIRTKAGVTYNHEAKSSYTVVVKADDGNSGTDTVTVTITVTDVTEPPGRPAAPSVSTTAGSTTSLDVSWTAPANTGPDIDTYDLRYREGTSGGWTNGPQNVTGTSAAIGSLDAGTAYQVQVRATNAEGDSDWSQSGSGTTGTPSNNPPTFPSSTANRNVAENTAAGQNVGAVLTATDTDSDPLTYTLEGTDAASFALDTTTTAGSARIRTKAGVTYNHEAKSSYTVVVKADDGNSGTDTVTVTITVTDVNEPPGRPAAPSVSATSGSTTSLDVSWTAPTNTGPPIDNYDLRYQKTTESNWTNGPQNQTGTSAAIGSLDAGTAYRVQVRATNAEGDSNWSPSGTGQTSGGNVPGAPTGLTAAADGQTGIDLDWNAPASNGGSPLTGYRIEVSSTGNSGSWIPLVNNTGNTSTIYSHTGLPAGTTRYYRVSARNANGAGPVSNVDSATTDAAPLGQVTGVNLTPSDGALTVGWTAVNGATGYKVQWKSGGESYNTGSRQATVPSGSTTNHTIGNLANGTEYTVRVIATKTGANDGPPSAEVRETPVSGQTTVTFGASSYTASEGGADATVAVELSPAPSAPVTIPLTPSRQGGATPGDYSGVPPSVTFQAGQTRRTFTVRATDDSVDDDGESVRIGFGPLPDGFVAGTRPTATVTLADDDGAVTEVFFDGAADLTVKEGNLRMVSVYLSEAAASTVTIPLTRTHRGGATAADYSGVPASVTFRYRQRRQQFTLRTVDDDDNDDNESLRIGFGPLPAGIRASTASHRPPTRTVHLEDDDGVNHWNVWFGKEAYTAAEGGAAARVSIHLDAPVEIAPLDVRLVLRYGGGGTAADHRSIPAVVTFALGERTKTITVTATDDAADDDGESVALWFGNPPNGRVSIGDGPITATVALQDNDGVEPVTVSFGAATYRATEGGSGAAVRVELDTAPGRSVTVPLTKANGGGATAADYSGIPANVTFGASQTARTFTVTATNDSADDGGESVSIGFGPLPAGVSAGSPAATAVALADDSQLRSVVVNFGTSTSVVPRVREGVRARFTLGLDSIPLRPVTIPLEVTHRGGATEADYEGIPASVTFGPNERQADFILRAVLDQQDETGEGLRIDLGPLPPGVRKGTWGPYETVEFVDTDPAAQASPSVAGPLLTLGYPGPLDAGSQPSPRDFVVVAEAPGRARAMLAVTAVAVRGSDVVLELDRPVTPEETVTLTYLAAAMHPIRDAAGLPAAPLADEPVRNDTGASGPLAALAAGTAIPAPLAALLEAAQESAGTERLDLSSRNLTDVSALAGLTGLRELDLSGNAITDLSPLAGLTGLQALDLRGNAIADLGPLAGLTGLRELDLASNRIADLWPLAGLAALQRLDLADNRIADIATLAELDGLRALDLAGNRIADLWPLAGLAALERLNLADNRIADIATLAELNRLRELDLAGNRIADLWPLAGLAALERLNLADNRIVDVSTLTGVAGLEVLLLDRNQVADVQALSQLSQLANLGLSDNRIADIGLLAELDRLLRLDLSGNAVADVAALGDVSRLVWLRLPGNPVSSAAPLERLEQLRWLWLDPGPAPGIETLAPPAEQGAAPLWLERTPAH